MFNRILFRGKVSPEMARQLTEELKGMKTLPLAKRKVRQALLCVLPFARHEGDQMRALLQWMHELGGCKRNPVLLVADCRVAPYVLIEMIRRAREAFRTVDFVQTPHALPDEKWPFGPNWMFETALKHITARWRRPFWWNEPDCVPLAPDWLKALEDDYYRRGKLFMGCIQEPTADCPCDTHLAGCAVYPASAIAYVQGTFGGCEAWDFASRREVLPQAAHTPLFQQEWGAVHHPPTFRSLADLARLRPGAVIYHRNKDGSLIRLLRERQHNESLHVSHAH